MIPAKEKAIQLVDNFRLNVEDYEGSGLNSFKAKQCALIAIDEIDDIYQKLTPKDDPYYFLLELEYWQEVKQELL